MLAGREGQPRSGKSYETVKVDLLEALRRGRRVFARINGLSVPAIAEYLKMTESEVSELLTVMTDSQVREWLVCNASDDGSVNFPHLPIGALVIVDECHEFYPVGRNELPPTVVNFFAKHGHWTLDVLLLTQDFKEVHRSVTRRLQKKNYYTKLDALGAEQRYSVRFYSAPSAGKFELLGSEQRKYDPDIFPLYHGITPQADTNPTYDVGTTTLWRTLRFPAIAMVLAALVGIFFIARFFMTPEAVAHQPKAATSTKPQPASTQPTAVAVPINAVKPVVPPPPPKPSLPPQIAYLLELPDEPRPRYLGSIGDLHYVEWRVDGGSEVIERLNSKQLNAMGWSVMPTDYGMTITYKTETIVFTPWPVEPRFQQSERLTRDIRDQPPLVSGPNGSAPLTSSDPSATGSGQPFGTMASYGDHGLAPKGTNSIGD